MKIYSKNDSRKYINGTNPNLGFIVCGHCHVLLLSLYDRSVLGRFLDMNWPPPNVCEDQLMHCICDHRLRSTGTCYTLKVHVHYSVLYVKSDWRGWEIYINISYSFKGDIGNKFQTPTFLIFLFFILFFLYSCSLTRFMSRNGTTRCYHFIT